MQTALVACLTVLGEIRCGANGVITVILAEISSETINDERDILRERFGRIGQ